MNKNQKELTIKSLIKDFSIETTPNVYAKYGKFSDMLSAKNNIYITFLPNESSEKIIETSKKLINEGFEVIPHLPARTIENKSSLEKYIGSLAEKSGCKKILVIGGGGKQQGNITSTMEVLKTDLLSKYNFSEVGVAGHPDGNPDITNEEIKRALIEKNQFSKNVDYKMYLTTQFFFEASSLKKWEKYLDEINNSLEIHAGIPGPATLKTLISYAASCGIGNSINFLSKQAMNITKLASTKTPDKLIADLADYKRDNPSSKLIKLHFYAFGGIKKTSEWLNKICQSPLIINEKNEFKALD